jgi:hypothetical protein
MRKNSLIIVFFLFLLLGCTSEMDKRVETVLSISGSNRTELEAVLDHYKHEPQKLKAAKFLIANMRYHHSFYSQESPTTSIIGLIDKSCGLSFLSFSVCGY